MGPARINFSKLYAVELQGTTRPLSVLQFFDAIRSDANLLRAWTEGLGLTVDVPRMSAEAYENLTSELLKYSHELVTWPLEN